MRFWESKAGNVVSEWLAGRETKAVVPPARKHDSSHAPGPAGWPPRGAGTEIVDQEMGRVPSYKEGTGAGRMGVGLRVI